MKRIALLVLMTVLAVPAFARPLRRTPPRPQAPVTLEAKRVAEPREFAKKILAQARAGRNHARKVGPDAVIINRSARALVVPAAGSAAGAGGTFFRTDLTLVNWNFEDQVLGVLWLPNGNPAGLDGFTVNVPGDRPPFTIQNFVGTVLGKTGVGSLVLLPLDENEEVDLDSAIDAYSRIWTPQPNATGTVSQPFPGVEPDYMTGEYEAFILGLRQDAGYRTNYGILNLYDEDITFNVTVFPDVFGGGPLPEANITVPALSMIQTNIPSGNHGLLTLAVSVEEDIPGDDHTWVTWASSTDNITGDGWVSLGANPWDDDDLDTVEP